MKHQQQYQSTRLLLPQAAAAPDHPSPACNRRSAMEEIARGQSLVTQLRAIVLPALQADQRSELVAHMFQNILDCSSKAMAELQLHHRSPSTRRPHDDDDNDDGLVVDDKKRVKRISSVGCKKEEEEGVAAANPRRHQHKRRRLDDSVSLETPVPHYDGRQWRKYGQKHINNTKHSRSYYRCTYRQEQGCRATKTVQQQDDSSSSSGADHTTLMYTVVYYGQHTCNKDHNDGGANSSRPDDSETNTRSSSDSQSSISSTCSANPGGHQNQTATASLHDSKPIDDDESAEELVMAKDMREPLDIAAFAPLDLDSWELDALLRFGA